MFFLSLKLYFKLLPGLLPAFVIFSLNLAISSQNYVSGQEVKKTQTNGKKVKTSAKPKNPATKPAKESPAELKQKAEAKKKADAAQKAALAEKNRREQINRAAQAKKDALEASFRTETVRNIARDDTLGEDQEIRRAAINALGSHAGTVVVMEPQTGKVLTIVNQEWAIRKSFKPCSTIKLVTAVAGLQEGLIDAEGNIRSRKFRLDLTDALAYSNNSYFQAVGAELGSEKMIFYAQQLGLGQPTGINSDDEAIGRLPFGNNAARIYSHGDDYEVTPLQLGVMVSAISNGGKIVIPQIPRSKVQKTSFRGSMRRTVNLPQKNLQGVIPGMLGAAAYGTARNGVDSSLGVAGKTGSCIEKGSWVGLFASVTPVVNPQYAVIVITRGRNERGKYAAAIAGKIYQVLDQRINRNTDRNLANTPLILKPQPKVNAKTSVQIDADEGEDSEDAAPETGKKTTAAKKPGGAKPAEIKKDNSPEKLFAPIVIEVKGATTRPRIVKNN